jgi:hypothetical protein
MSFWKKLFGSDESSGGLNESFISPGCDHKFSSNQHVRRENGVQTGVTDNTTYRGVQIEHIDGKNYRVSISMIDGVHPVWGDNLTMAPKVMRVMSQKKGQTVLGGIRGTSMLDDYSDYSITVIHPNNQISSITLHMLDRLIDITYLTDKKQEVELDSAAEESSFELIQELINLAVADDVADRILRSVVMEDHPFLYNKMGLQYQELGRLDKACSCFLQGAKLHVRHYDDLEDAMIVLGIGQCITNLTTNFRPSDINSSYKCVKLAYLLLSQAADHFKIGEAHYYRATLFAGHEVPMIVQSFLTNEAGLGMRLEPYLVADFHDAALKEEPKNVEMLEHASSIHQSLGDDRFAGKDADDYELDEFVALGRKRHLALYEKFLGEHFRGDMMLTEEDFEGLVMREN